MVVLRASIPAMPSAASGTTAAFLAALVGLADRLAEWSGGRVPTAAGRITSALVSPLASPLAPDDYLGLIDPLLSARHPAGRVIAVRPECAGAATRRSVPGAAGRHTGPDSTGRWGWRSTAYGTGVRTRSPHPPKRRAGH